jgi:rare lipoprotein A (peptidoglycan hydrolase)
MLSVPLVLLFHSHLPAAAAAPGDETQVAGVTTRSGSPPSRTTTSGSMTSRAEAGHPAATAGGPAPTSGEGAVTTPAPARAPAPAGSRSEEVDAQALAAVPEWAQDNEQAGMASWYGAASGTCANLTLAFGTVVTVTNVVSGASTTCVVDDRGPYPPGRIIDLSEDVFAKLAAPGQGVIQVRLDW